MIYRVKVGYNTFDIPDDKTAMSFAELAKRYIVQDRSLYPIDVSIDLIDEEVAEDE